MKKLADPAVTRELIEKYDFDFRKRFGQNFLIDPSVPERIVELSKISKTDLVIEIGPGIGTLTQYLAKAAGRVVSIEIDRKLIPILETTLADYDNVTVINQDVLKTDLNELIEKYGRCSQEDGTVILRPVRIVANLPYYITTPILMSLFRMKLKAKSITVMVQKEVADRMQASPGSKEYGSLSLAVQLYARPHVELEVLPKSFMPRPKVVSCVICLDIYEKAPVELGDEELFHKIIKAAFSQRRKTLVNALGNSDLILSAKEDVRAALEKLNLPETIRGESLDLHQFADLTNLLLDDQEENH